MNIKLKRILAIGLVCAMSFSTIACGKTAQTETAAVAESTAESEVETAAETVAETESVAETEALVETVAETETETESETETEKETEAVQAVDWSDFSAEAVLVEEATSQCIDLSAEYFEIFCIEFNHKDEVARIDFYRLNDQDLTTSGDYSDNNRTAVGLAFVNGDGVDLAAESVYIRYAVPEIIPDLVIRFTAKDGTIAEYVVTYNGRDGGASLAPLS